VSPFLENVNWLAKMKIFSLESSACFTKKEKQKEKVEGAQNCRLLAHQELHTITLT
jgi:hypothetical protein